MSSACLVRGLQQLGVPKFGLRVSCEEACFVRVIPGAETEVSSAGRMDISHVDSHVDKLKCDGRPLVVL